MILSSVFRRRLIIVLVVVACSTTALLLGRHWWTTDWSPQAQVLRYRIIDVGYRIGLPGEAPRPENLLLGSSTIRWMTDPKADCGSWFNRGVGGATSPDILSYVEVARAQHWKRVLIYTGDNDIAFGAPVAVALANAGELLAAVRRKFSPDTVLIVPIKLSPARSQFAADFTEFNAGMAALAAQKADLLILQHSLAGPDIDHLFYREDGIHLNAEGYEQLFEPLQTYCSGQLDR